MKSDTLSYDSVTIAKAGGWILLFHIQLLSHGDAVRYTRGDWGEHKICVPGNGKRTTLATAASCSCLQHVFVGNSAFESNSLMLQSMLRDIGESCEVLLGFRRLSKQ